MKRDIGRTKTAGRPVLILIMIAIAASTARTDGKGQEVANGELRAGDDSGKVSIASPDGGLRASIAADPGGRLVCNLARGSTAVLENSPLGVVVDGVDLGLGVRLGHVRTLSHNGHYPLNGGKSDVVNHYHGADIQIMHEASGAVWTLQTRMYDDGFAFRYVVPGSGMRKVLGERTAWVLPSGCQVWFQTNIMNYEGIYQKQRPEDIERGTDMGPPVTVELPGGGFAAITEGSLFHYSGMTLQATGSPRLEAAFRDDPDGWQLDGTVRTPWRITMVAADLNRLVNCDIVHNVCDPPDQRLFPQGARTRWIKPGRAVWSWWSGGTGNLEVQKRFVDGAAKLGFEYNLVDAGWERWRDGRRGKWELLKELVDYAKQRNVGIFVWRYWASRPNRSEGVDHPESRHDFLDHCRQAGVVGVKIDFMDSECKDRIDFYEDVLRDAAKYQLMVNFHGANKPTGESRTWPNEINREGIFGLEMNRGRRAGRKRITIDHYVSLPFTRLLAGHADFTPCTFNPESLYGTTYTLQLATAIVYTSPLLHWADRPDVYLKSPAIDVIRAIPSVWDETRVLPGSKIGELAAFARRKGDAWFVAIINGAVKRQYEVDLPFLADGEYSATLVRDDMNRPEQMIVQRTTVNQSTKLSISMRVGGGFVAYLNRR